MSKQQQKFKSKVDGKEYLFIRSSEYLKEVPLDLSQKPSGLHLYFDNLYQHYDVYDKSGHTIRNFQLIGYDTTPSFFISSGTSWFKIEPYASVEEADAEPRPLSEISELNHYPSGSNIIKVESSATGWIIFKKKEGFGVVKI